MIAQSLDRRRLTADRHVECAVIGLLSDKARMKTLGINAGAAASVYDWRQIAETLVAWMQEVA